jgi:hypothetical protein
MIHVEEIHIPTGLSIIPELVLRMLPEIAEAVKTEIVAEATRTLNSSQQDYVSSLQLMQFAVSPTDLKRAPKTFASIILTGQMPNMIEHGWAGGDMKPALLSGPNAKVGKTGIRYNTVHFRHGTPGTTGGRVGTPMGGLERKRGMSRTQAEMLGKKVHRAAEKLTATKSHADHGTKWGERLSHHAAAHLGAPTHQNRHTGYKHKSSIYGGMVRQEKTYRAAAQNKYSTFRRVSDNSDPGSWFHGGITAHHFFDKAARKIPAITNLMFQGMMKGGNRGFATAVHTGAHD